MSRSGYGTLQAGEYTTLWEKAAEPPSLLLHVGIAIAKQLAALLLLFWQIFHYYKLLMRCDSRIVGFWAYPCEYTKTFVRCFPLLAASVVLLVGCRCMLQQRIYYGLLKRGALLDFQNTKAWHDPLFFILLFSFAHSIAHFAMDVFVPDGFNGETGNEKEMFKEMEAAAKNYILPAMIFFAFLCASYDVEATLVPLSKYFEENPPRARQMASKMPFLDEEEVQAVIPQLGLKTSTADTTLDVVYYDIIKRCPEQPFEEFGDKAQSHPLKWQLFETLWPAKVLLDPRLVGPDAIQFRRLFVAVSTFSVAVMLTLFCYFVYQATKDFKDVAMGQHEDMLSLVVLLAHAVVIAWILNAVIRMLMVLREKVDDVRSKA